jgi:hypothetical protein
MSQGVHQVQRFSRLPKVQIAAKVATLVFAVAILLQLLLAIGIVPITMAWGGTQPTLTPTLRIASLAAAAILALFAYVIRRRAGLIGVGPVPRAITIAAWIVAIFLSINAFGNFASPSEGERMLFGPISFVLAVSTIFVVSSKPTA